MNKIIIAILAVGMIGLLCGCGPASVSSSDAGSDGSYYAKQEVRESPAWVTALDACKEAIWSTWAAILTHKHDVKIYAKGTSKQGGLFDA